MKTKFFKWASVATIALMSVSFAACSDDDDDKKDDGKKDVEEVVGGKKISSITISEKDSGNENEFLFLWENGLLKGVYCTETTSYSGPQTTTALISYNGEGKIDNVLYDGDVYRFTYENEKMKINYAYAGGDGEPVTNYEDVFTYGSSNYCPGRLVLEECYENGVLEEYTKLLWSGGICMSSEYYRSGDVFPRSKSSYTYDAGKNPLADDSTLAFIMYYFFRGEYSGDSDNLSHVAYYVLSEKNVTGITTSDDDGESSAPLTRVNSYDAYSETLALTGYTQKVYENNQHTYIWEISYTE